jgi:hypothetical protein
VTSLTQGTRSLGLARFEIGIDDEVRLAVHGPPIYARR